MGKNDKITNPLYGVPFSTIISAMLKHPKMTNKQVAEAARKRREERRNK